MAHNDAELYPIMSLECHSAVLTWIQNDRRSSSDLHSSVVRKRIGDLEAVLR
jgi:hypothetical protein